MVTLGFRVLAVLLFGFVLAPIAVVVVTSFSAGTVPEFPPSSWSLRWYAHALSQPVFLDAARNSAVLAALATLVNVPIALAAALALTRGRFPGREAIQTVLLAPLIVPAVVTGIAILLAFSAAGWRDPMSRLLLAHVVVTLPYMVRTIMASLARLDPVIEEAAMTLGASRLRAFLHVTLPLLLPGLVAGAVFAFIVSFDNVSVSLFLTTARTSTLPIAILGYVEFNFDPSIAAISTLLIAASLVAAILVERAVGLRRALGH